MTITIVNKYKPIPLDGATLIYCGRGSALGNPFPMVDNERSLASRDRVCDRYQEWFDQRISSRDNAPRTLEMYDQLHAIRAAAIDGDVHLQCFCAPKRCHCETIKAEVERSL